LRQVAADFEGQPVTRGRTLLLGELADVEVETDSALVARILVNMVTNALEATPAGGEVRLSCRLQPWEAGFACAYRVQNGAVMPAEVAARVFDRSFSTKAGQGRGLGTYSMKLLGERYLGGEVSFTSEEATGTVFTLRLPLRPPRSQAELARVASAS
jgi:signal transduction histidine kinase